MLRVAEYLEIVRIWGQYCLFQYCRFYSHDSSFVHGGIEKPGEELPPVMGQAVNFYHAYSFFSDALW